MNRDAGPAPDHGPVPGRHPEADRSQPAAAARAAVAGVAVVYAGPGRAGVALAYKIGAGLVPVVLFAVLMVPLFAAGSRAPTLVAAQGAGIDPTVADAYAKAADAAPALFGDRCVVRWTILAGIGRVETNNAAGAAISATGDVAPPIVGVALDGTGGTAAVADTDGGVYDADTVWDRAVGPAQFIPTSWAVYGQDGNGDGAADPHNIYDAAYAMAALLCGASPGDYTNETDLRGAIGAYNQSQTYVDDVVAWIYYYDSAAAQTNVAAGIATAGAYTLPVPAELYNTNPGWFTAAHHTYPAIDLPVATGTPIYIAHGGIVASVSANPTNIYPAAAGAGGRCGYGATIIGDDGYTYTYCHGSTQPAAAVGDRVETGDPLMASGNSGNSSGPHLHFGIATPGGVDVCPQPLLAAWANSQPDPPTAAPTAGCTT